MPTVLTFSLIVIALFVSGCAETKSDAGPLDVLKAYGSAFAKKDPEAMKRMLTFGSIAMLEQEAKAQGVSLDEVVLKETLFTQGQSTAEFRNVRIEDLKAKIDMKDSAGLWITVYFMLEDGIWKIDKQGFANELLRQSEEEKKRLDAMINGSQVTSDK